MCRLLGVAANTTVYLTFSLLLSPNPFRGQAKENPDGWGIATHKDGWSVSKEMYSAGESAQFEKLSNEASGNIIISHLRKATIGQKNLANTHPFQQGNWIFAHNGTVRNSRKLRTAPQFQPNGTTDSEKIFCAILTDLHERCGRITDIDSTEVAQSVRNVFEYCLQLDKNCKTNFVFSDGELLYVLRHGHPLFWLLREPRPRETLQSKTLKMLEAKALKGEKAVLVATEKLTDETWQEVEPDQLFFADPQNISDGLQLA